ncbi:uncharacterized protein M421DRAFT_51331 [Didymella exigua CBS 183.55]|uniref:Uncharacterized protein n=1 Tax=Didymella exigua CBS 183.55 TaxID=1150837 RepID=A0A6A5S8S0_9PLEO|nr:uncharacterized protein M421DRAFT_51331 [Didymella exigua CBS 183.55]KAF1933907.1 hypothetical protein M421DRAFT_51331 [Didymella exigua CBS 183.55]
MPIDRNTPNHSRPLKPALASNRTAANGKTPITPRLALAPSTPSSSSSQISRTLRSANGVTPRLAAPVKEDTPSSKALLSANVTPRTTTRRSRVGVSSNSSTPNASPATTPSSSRPSSTIDFAHREHGSAQSGPAINANHRPRSTVGGSNHNAMPTPRLPLSNIYNHTPPEASQAKDASPMFFHASSVKSPREQVPPQRAPQKKAAVFFHANGDQVNSPQRPTVPSPPSSAVGRPSSAIGSRSNSKFLHADSTPEVRAPPMLSPTLTGTVPDLARNPTAAPQGPPGRAASPTKDWGHLSYRKGASQIMRPNLHTRNSALSVLSGISVSEEPDNSRRRSSVTSSLSRPGHYKSASLSSIDSVADLRRVPSHEGYTTTPSPVFYGNRVVSNGSSVGDNTAPTPSPLAISQNALPSPGLASPTKPAGEKSVLEMMNDLAANARRERKVLDLEISNSSLLAINRSLEKEMRKQKAELKRLRRMSRAGRFSMDAIGSTLDTFTAKKASDLSDMSEVEEEEEMPSEEEVESSDSSFDESGLETNVQAERDESYRIEDEKRLQLDLAKHRDLLMDSQKMNESLKRCLSWTDQLIKDAQKALDYKVNVSEVRIGGRVLVVEDDEEEETTEHEEARGLLSPWSPPQRAADTLDPPVPDFARAENRDSGVDVGRVKHDGHDLPEEFSPLGSPFGDKLSYLHAAIDDLETS